MTKFTDLSVQNDEASRLVAAIRFLDGLPEEHEGPDRALAFRAMVAAGDSPQGLVLLRAVYECFAETNFVPYSLHDAQMVVASVTERLELLPLLEPYVDRFLKRKATDQDLVYGLWQYVKQLYQMRRVLCQASQPIGGLGGHHAR